MARTDEKDWEAEAKALPNDEFAAPVPIHVFLGEAVDVAVFFAKYWKASEELPGMEEAGRGLSPKLGEEILALQNRAQLAQSAYVLTVPKSATGEVATRASFVRSELCAGLKWLFDDGVEDEKDAKLAAVREAHDDDPNTNDAFAGELEDYGTLARQHKKELEAIKAFDVAFIDEAFELAHRLRLAPATPQVPTEESRRALARRNRLLTLLGQRVARVRAAARFVFRNHPKVIREVTSAYERRRRAEARRKALKEGAATTPAPGTPPAPPA